MAYDPLNQNEREARFEDVHSTDSSPVYLASPTFAPLSLFLDDENTRNHENAGSAAGFGQMFDSITSRTAESRTSYGIVEEDDYEGGSPVLSTEQHRKGSSPSEPFVPLNIPRPRPERPHLSTQATTTTEDTTILTSPRSARSASRRPIVRTASGRSLALRHPTPDLQVLQGAYTGNIEHLEKTAERLSMTSSIDDAIRQLHDEQKRNDSRRSSLLSSPDMPSISRQVSNASSIVETNNLARSGGFSPSGFMMSPKGSFTTGGRGRSASKSSRYGSRPEPELEGRPLDSFVNNSSGMSPVLSRSDSIAEQDESPTTPVAKSIDLLDGNVTKNRKLEQKAEKERPSTSASMNNLDQMEQMFADFDGVHMAPQSRSLSEGEPNNGKESSHRRKVSFEDQLSVADEPLRQRRSPSNDRLSVARSDSNGQRRVSSNDRLSMARPQSYADPNTGQQMVYYPAPVPMMLNLPQKLSKMPSSIARNKRRSQVLSSIPPAARQSAIWLPDVLEIEDEPDLPDDDGAQQMEYVAQHQRATMGGRRLTQDVQHLPAQLRATAFFDLPGPNQMVELKEQSAVATLDSILDASAHAPVSAFTDHVFAGHLGAEVYGRPALRNSKSSSNLLSDEKPKKRTSSFNLLRGRRASSSEVLESESDRRRNTIADMRDGKILHDEEEDDADARALREFEGEDDDEEEEDDAELYHGAPTTLLAELQLRKQQQKHRTRPLGQAYPNGMHSTLLELDAVAQVEKNTRKQKRVNLAWEDPNAEQEDDGDDEDVPLAMLYAKKSRIQEPNRPMGLMERRDMEDNEPLSRRRDRLQGRPPPMNRASTMINMSSGVTPEEEGETLAERVRRLKGEGRSSTGLPSARPVSGDFASEMMSQFGGDLLGPKADVKGKGKEVSTSPGPEEEETLGQRRKRLQAEKEARAIEVGAGGDAPERPGLQKRRSMADILQAHPAAGGNRVPSYTKPPAGLLGLHDKVSAQRASTMLNLDSSRLPGAQSYAGGFKAGMYNDGQGGIIPPPKPQPQRSTSNFNLYNTAQFQQFPQPSLGYGFQNGMGNQMMMPFANPYAMAYPNAMNGVPMSYTMPNMQAMGAGAGLGLGLGNQPLNQGQIDMVERWRQSVMH